MKNIKRLLRGLFVAAFAFILIGCTNEKNTDEQESNQNNIGYVEKENVEVLVTRFNNHIFDNSGLGPITDDYLKIEDNKYWYGITDGIYLIVVPMEGQSGTEAIVDSMQIYVEKEFIDDPQVIAYTKMLIMSNNSEITNNEAANLIDESSKLSNEKLASNNGKGISVRYLKYDDHYEYQVIRNYK